MKILVYDDNPDFGGHQVMARRGIEALANHPAVEITCMANPANRKLCEALSAFNVAEARPDAIAAIKPDLVLCVQGDITQSTAGIAAARAAGIECVSYLALPHSLAEMGAKLGAARDLAHRKWLNKPDRFIVISKEMKRKLSARGTKKPITVVSNGIPAPPTPKVIQRGETTTIGLIGRVEFSQKRQDFMVETFLAHPAAFGNCQLLIVGSGPDEHQLKKRCAGSNSITLQAWTNDIERRYEQIDFLMIPSRYEGVPLVMLEALARGIPVIASNRDGMKDVLPAEWMFKPGDTAELARAFSHVKNNGHKTISDLQRKILAKHSLESFNTNFVRSVTKPSHH